jgi:Raf kinase inhibitor-like YbhB/YbcL family protein
MSMLHEASKAVGKALSSTRAGAHQLTLRKLELDGLPRLSASSPAFTGNGSLPRTASADGGSVPPRIEWSEPPPGTRSFALICEDPDAPMPEPFVHWIVYDIPGDARCLDEETLARAHQGKNSKLRVGFTGAAPPLGHGVHHYHFQLLALDTALDLQDGEGRGDVVNAVRGHVLAWADLVGTFERR